MKRKFWVTDHEFYGLSCLCRWTAPSECPFRCAVCQTRHACLILEGKFQKVLTLVRIKTHLDNNFSETLFLICVIPALLDVAPSAAFCYRSHFEPRAGICCTEIKEDQKITNAFNPGLAKGWNDLPQQNSHSSITDEVFVLVAPYVNTHARTHPCNLIFMGILHYPAP